MFKEIHKGEWISTNGKWKVFVRVQEQSLNDGSKIFINDILVSSFVRKNVWKSESMNEKLPKYVAAEVEKARMIVDSFRKETIAS